MMKRILFAIPELLLAKADVVAANECRTRSDLLREAIRRYIDEPNRKRVEPSTDSGVSVTNVELLEQTYANSN